MQAVSGMLAPDAVTLEVSNSGKLQIKDGGVDTAQLANNAVDDTKLADGAVPTKIGILTGTVAHGGTIPLPSGFIEAQCKWMVSVYQAGNPSAGDGDNIEEIQCSATAGRVVTCRVYTRNAVYVNGTANYIIVGVK